MISIKVPQLGESIVEATVARWLKREGDAVAAGDTIVELETDKITVEVPALKAGTLVKQLHHEGDVVTVDEELGQLDDTAVPSAAAGAAAPQASAATTSGSAATTAVAAPPAIAAPALRPPTVAPAAQRTAAESGIDVAGVSPTGRGGTVITKGDVIAARDARAVPRPSAPSPAPVPERREPAESGARETRERMTTRRKRIAENLLQAQHATAHLTTFNEVDMSGLIAVRDRLKERVEKEHEVKLTFMPFFARATCLALAAYPVVNAQIDGDTIIYKHYVHLGIAVASDQGLVVPVIRDADRKGMIEFSRDLSAVARRAREGKLTLDDLTGGTFTITNGGVFGSLLSTPILNYPQVGILGLHKIQDRPVAVDGRMEIRPMMYIALSYDHRIVDGQQAVLFLVRVKELMEDPASMLIA